MARLYTLAALVSSASASVISQLNGGRLTGNAFGIAGLNATYDYVIVGGGTAGNLIANRLTQYTNASVAIIEAGSFYELSNVSEQWEGPDKSDWQPLVDWGYQTEPQIGGQTIHYAQGRTLGGGSARNQMMYNRPTKGAYQLWADMVGDQSYTWDNMLPHMARSMQFTPNIQQRSANVTPTYNTSVFSSQGGPLHLSYPNYVYPISYYGKEIFSSIGLKEIPGFTTGVLQGYGFWQFMIDPTTSTRSSSETSFLQQALGRPGLTTYINSMGRNILFSGKKAVGVNVTNYGQQPFTLTARKEVIVSSGIWNSPQLLMVSGIGPKQTLQKFGIPVIANLQGVGQNTHDSAAINGPIYEISKESTSTWQIPAKLQEAIDIYNKNRTGPMTNIGLDVGAYEKLPAAVVKKMSAQAQKDLAQFPADWPHIEYMIAGAQELALGSNTNKNYATITCFVVATTSRGNMTIRSASNLDPPVINPNWLLNKTDQEVAVAGFKRAREAWKAVPISVGEEYFPGPNVTSDADILKAIETNLIPTHHGTASCKMGKKGDPMAVVDNKARVFGVQNLRVIDSSSMPFTPPGHSMGATYAHAEKLVQDVIDTYLASA